MSRRATAAASAQASAPSHAHPRVHGPVAATTATAAGSKSSVWWSVLSLPSVLFLFPSRLLSTTPCQLLETLILWPLELYEHVAIVPVGFVRRHMPIVGGALVVLMTLHGILMRLFLEVLHGIFARITFSPHPVLNYRTFWRAMRDQYAGFGAASAAVDWGVVHQLFGQPLQTTTSEEDLWIALQESIAMCDDPALRVSRGALTAYGRTQHAAARLKYQDAAMDVLERRHLTDGGRRIANHMVYGILNAETSPGWRIGYLAIHSMTGFVDFPLPRLDSLVPLWGPDGAPGPALGAQATKSMAPGATSKTTRRERLLVPEIYDLESMRWALEAVLRCLGELDGLILDLRFNAGGGTLASALSIGSFFAGPRRSVAFTTDEKLPGGNGVRFSKRRQHYIPRSGRAFRYGGPLVILQSQYTRGTAELLAMSLMRRPNTSRVGATTAGSLSQTRKLRLPNYWTVEIPYQRCFSADGELFEGVGLPADKLVVGMEEELFRARSAVAAGQGELRDIFDPCIKCAIDQIMNV